MTPYYPETSPKAKYNVTIKAGFVGTLMFKELDDCDILTFLRFYNRLQYIDYCNHSNPVSLEVERVDGNNNE